MFGLLTRTSFDKHSNNSTPVLFEMAFSKVTIILFFAFELSTLTREAKPPGSIFPNSPFQPSSFTSRRGMDSSAFNLDKARACKSCSACSISVRSALPFIETSTPSVLQSSAKCSRASTIGSPWLSTYSPCQSLTFWPLRVAWTFALISCSEAIFLY